MVAVLLLTIGPPVLILGLRLVFQRLIPRATGRPAPSVFSALCNPMAQFGFIVAAVGAAGDDRPHRRRVPQLVITGRSRLSLYLARIPAGLSILLPMVALAFTMVCLVTRYLGTPQPRTVSTAGFEVPVQLDQAGLHTWLLQHPRQAADGFPGSRHNAAQARSAIDKKIPSSTRLHGRCARRLEPGARRDGQDRAVDRTRGVIGFMVGLGFGSLIGQRTVTTILLIALQIVVTPIGGPGIRTS